MKNKYLIIFLLVSLISCEKGKSNEDELVVNVFNVGLTNATILWEEFNSSGNVLFDIVLNDIIIASEISEKKYTFTDLKPNVYAGKVIAKYSNGERTVGFFNFTTTTIDIDIEITDYVIDLDNNNEVTVSLNWQASTDETSDIHYTIYVDKIQKCETFINQCSLLLELDQKNSISIVATYLGNEYFSEIDMKTPSSNEIVDSKFSLATNYIGYTAINLLLEGINPSLSNSIYYNGDLIETDYYNSEYLISDLPINSDLSKIAVVSYINDSVGLRRSLNVMRKALKRLPDNDLLLSIESVNDVSAVICARNVSDNPHFEESLVGRTNFKVYLNNQFKYEGKYVCNSYSSFEEEFPAFGGLTPETEYTVKVEVDYGNTPINSDYEPVFPLTTFKELSFTTLSSGN